MAECQHGEGARCRLLRLGLGPRECIGVNEASCPLALLADRAQAWREDAERLAGTVKHYQDMLRLAADLLADVGPADQDVRAFRLQLALRPDDPTLAAHAKLKAKDTGA